MNTPMNLYTVVVRLPDYVTDDPEKVYVAHVGAPDPQQAAVLASAASRDATDPQDGGTDGDHIVVAIFEGHHENLWRPAPPDGGSAVARLRRRLDGHTLEVDGQRFPVRLEFPGYIGISPTEGIEIAATPGWDGYDGVCIQVQTADGASVLEMVEVPIHFTGDEDKDVAAWTAAVLPIVRRYAEGGRR